MYLNNEATPPPSMDSPAVWVNVTSPEDSLIVGTLKKAGLAVFTLQGELIQSIATQSAPSDDDEESRFNGVAMLNSEKYANVSYILISDRGFDIIRFFSVQSNKTHPLVEVTDESVPRVFSTSQEEVNEQATVYGIAATNYDGQMLVFVSQRSKAVIRKLEVVELTSGKLNYTLLEKFDMQMNFTMEDGYVWTACFEDDGDYGELQSEGMVADPLKDTFIYAQEGAGLFKTSLSHWGEDIEMLDATELFGVEYTRVWDAEEEEYICTYSGPSHGATGNIIADAEGLQLYSVSDGSGFYILASQGADRYEMYDRSDPSNHLGSFTVSWEDGPVIGTDGLCIESVPLGNEFPNGVLVVHHEQELDDDTETTSLVIVNFSLVLKASTSLENCDSTDSTDSAHPPPSGMGTIILFSVLAAASH